MSGYWAPKPLVKADPNGLFPMDETITIITKGLTPIERQRKLDGTPHTVTGRTALKPEGPALYLGEDKLAKSHVEDEKPKMKSEDVDAVIKAYLTTNAEC